MYTKDKSNRITLRLNEEQFGFVKGSAERYGVSPSDFLRMVINSTMFAAEEGKRRENEQTSKHDLVQH
jgi:predicted DNA binding CopG/RHH family protein